MSPHEFKSRLQHLINTMQCVALNSSLTDHNDKSWEIGREYHNRVNADIQDGIKSWSSLSASLQADCYVFARDWVSVKPEGKSDKPAARKEQKDQKSVQSTCRDYNTKSNEGELCSWEVENTGKRCNRLHVCSSCIKSGANRTHRAMDCSSAGKNKGPFTPQGSGP